MKLFVGLGNPGENYSLTWHNAGFMAVEYIGEKMRSSFDKKICRSEVASAQWRGETIILAKPQTYMNESGRAVAALLANYSLGPEKLTIFHDDIDIELGKVKEKKSGGSAGQNGVESIIENIGTGDFRRFRIGVGRPPEGMNPADYVLSQFDEEGGKTLAESIEKCFIKALNLN